MPVTPSYTVRLRNHAHDLDANAHLPAAAVPYDHATSGLAATQVQAAIDEIVAGGGGPSGGVFDVRTYGAVVDDATDDTVAVQATIDAATAAGGGTIWVPGLCLIAGALRDTGARNAQLLLPNVSTSADQVTLRFLGPLRPPFAFHGSGIPASAYGGFRSTLAGASGTAAMISGGNGTPPTQNNVQVIVENIITILPDNPTLSGWNLSTTQAGIIDGLQITTQSAMAGSGTQPTHSNSYGIKLAQPYNSNGTKVDGLSVGYFYTGVLQGELATVQGLVLGPCVVGIELGASIHASIIVSMQASGCAYGIRVTGIHRCDVLQYDSEHYIGGSYSAWQNPVYDLDDASNFFYGTITWFDVGATAPTPGSFTYDHIFNVNGGTNGLYHEIGTGIASTLDALTDVTITSPAASQKLRYNGSLWVNVRTWHEPQFDYTGSAILDGAGNPIMVEVVS